MTILFLIGKYPGIGGVETVSTILANEFVRQGHQVLFASFEQEAADISRPLDPSIDLIKLNYPILHKSNVAVLKNLIETRSIDIIINQRCIHFYFTLLCRRAIGKSPCKLVAVHHNSPDTNSRITDVEIELGKKGNIFRTLFLKSKLALIKKVSSKSIRFVYKKSDAVVVFGKGYATIYRDFARLNDDLKFHAIPNPITIAPDKYKDVEVKREKKLLYVGRIDHNQKRVERIIDVWKHLAEKYPDWTLRIVGDGPDKERIQKKVMAKNIKNVIFIGFSNPVEHYKRASILLLASEYEGFPLVVTESMAFGVVPVVYGSYAGVYDIRDSSGAVVVVNPPFDSKKFSKEIESLMTNEEYRNRLSEKALSAVTQFTLENISSQWINLFKSLHHGKT